MSGCSTCGNGTITNNPPYVYPKPQPKDKSQPNYNPQPNYLYTPIQNRRPASQIRDSNKLL